MAPAEARPFARWRLLVLGAALAALLVALLWRSAAPQPDMIAVLHANNRGIGLLEQYKYAEAADAFAEVIRLAADWTPGHVNHAIALLNQAQPQALAQAALTFEEVLRREPDNPYAHYCLGIILLDQGTDFDRTAREFEAVTRLDSSDPHAWYFLGRARLNQQKSALAIECFKRALELAPDLSAAMNNLQLLLRGAGRMQEADVWLARFQKLIAADWYTRADIKYGEMGRYADAVGRVAAAAGTPVGPLPLFPHDENLQVELAGAARWASTQDFGTGPEPDLLRAIRARFGGTITVLDYDRDGKPDLLLLAAVEDGGQVRDLLLHNEGEARFRDVTLAVGLGGARLSLGCTAADFDNDGYADLLLTTTAGVRLFRNRGAKGAGRFEEVSGEAGIDLVHGVCLGAAFADVDQDGDLDLLLARVAPSPAAALAALERPTPVAGGVLLLLNVGAAPPAAGKEMLPLAAKFRLATEQLPELKLPALNLLVSDLDSDRDIDVLVLGAGHAPEAILNDRLLAFHHATLPHVAVGTWTGGLVLDADQDERSDLVLLGPARPPFFLLQRGKQGKDWFQAGSMSAPPLVQAVAADVDLDGWPDVVGLSAQRRPVLLHNQGLKFVHALEAFGADAEWPADLIGVASADVHGAGRADLLAWSETQGLRLQRNQGNGNHGLAVELTGRHEQGVGLRTNSDAIGARVTVRTPKGQPSAEVATTHAGLGQARTPLVLGLGRFAQADVVTVRWPDGTWQAELSVPAEQVALIKETNRKPVSCPILFAWDGRSFGFVSDFLGAASVGECLPGGTHRQPRAEEAIKIESHQLAPQDGRYLLKLAEPMDEVTYLDRLQLLIVDHAAGLRAYPDERFLADPRAARQDLLVFQEGRQVWPRTVRDQRGRDLTSTLRAWDRVTVDGFAPRAWLGYAEEHWIELDFADRLARVEGDERLGLFLAGWTDYPFPESIWAATQAGIALQAPRLERLGPDGAWQTIMPELGFPAGLPRLTSADVTGLLVGPSCRLRISSNMHVYWDQVFVAPIEMRVAATATSVRGECVRVTARQVQAARLEVRGCVQEYSPDGREPTLYAYERLDRVPVTRLSGRLTRLGDVTELLQERDDCFAVFGPGDELSVAFDATGLPALPSGWSRSFVLRTWGYCKDASPFTATGGTIEPLPFAAMSGFPYRADEHYPATPRHAEYLRRYQTRLAGAAR